MNVKRILITLSALCIFAGTVDAAKEFTPPEERGKYGVGYTDVLRVDHSRVLGNGNPRPLRIEIWYPRDDAAIGTTPQYVYAPLVTPIPSVFGALEDVPAHPDGNFPVIVLQHGNNGLTDTVMTEALASQGFVVASANVTGNTTMDAAADFIILYNSPVFGAPLGSTPIFPCPLPGQGPAPFALCSETSNVARDRVLDIAYIISELDLIDQSDGDHLSGSMDIERIGLMGHSFGATSVLRAAGGYEMEGILPLPNIKAVVAVESTPVDPVDLQAITASTMLIAGSEDTPGVSFLTFSMDNLEELTMADHKILIRIPHSGHIASGVNVCFLQALFGQPIPQNFVEIIVGVQTSGTPDPISSHLLFWGKEADPAIPGLPASWGARRMCPNVEGYERLSPDEGGPIHRAGKVHRRVRLHAGYYFRRNLRD